MKCLSSTRLLCYTVDKIRLKLMKPEKAEEEEILFNISLEARFYWYTVYKQFHELSTVCIETI